MASLRLYNSLTKKVEPFTPLHDNHVGIYHCGPTVYKRQHIGNMRRYLFADFLRRTLDHLGYDVHDVMNITDVGHLTDDDLDTGEDKVEHTAREQKTTPQAIAEEQIRLFHEDLGALTILPAREYPRATDHIKEMQAIIATLLAKGHAYQTSQGIYFSVASWPDYGKLSGNRLDQIAPGSRIDVDPEKKHPADFAVWKCDDTHLQRWESPWGMGYPGWHIECSAMSQKYLGTPIDIHTGGEDNRFPHHENEIAQSEAAFGAPFVRWWLHNAHLKFGGAKLSKRAGTQITLDDIRTQGYSPLAFRMLVFGSHYRHALDFSWESLQAAQGTLESLTNVLRRLQEVLATFPAATPAPDSQLVATFDDALADDLNTPHALGLLLMYIHTVHSQLDKGDTTIAPVAAATLAKCDEVLGVMEYLKEQLAITLPPEVHNLLTQRETARTQRDFTAADELRQKIHDAGFIIEDTPQGPRLVKK